jgi:hypothetical protein
VAEDRFETRSIPDLRGWIRRSPLLAVALAMAALATFGLPGWVALETRVSLASLAVEAPWAGVVMAAGLLTLPVYLRLFWVGTGRVTSRVDRSVPERVVRRRKPIETLPVELEGAGAPAGTDAGVAQAAGPGLASAAATAARGAATSARETAGRARTAATGATSSMRGALSRGRSPGPAPDAAPDVSAGASPAGDDRRTTATDPGTGASAGTRFVNGLRRNRTELLSGAVLALAVLAVLTSWGALDIAGAAAEPAPIIIGPGTD